MSNESTTTTDAWISTIEARRRLGVTVYDFSRLLKRGVFTVRQLPGMRPKVLLADVERVEREAIRPATVAV